MAGLSADAAYPSARRACVVIATEKDGVVPPDNLVEQRLFGAHRPVRWAHGADGKLFGAARVRTARGRAMGLLTGVILLALLSTPPLFGLIFDLIGSYNGIFWTFCGLALAALLWLPAIRMHPLEPAAPVPAPVPGTPANPTL